MLPEVRTEIPGPRSREMARRLRRVESPDTTFVSPEFPVFWRSAAGCLVEDVDGNRFLDMNAGFGVTALGHAPPRLTEILGEQAGRLVHGMGDVHPSEQKLMLAERLIALAPPGREWKAIFGVTGSDAVEAALKTAAVATGRSGLISFEGGYHGITLGALAATGWPKFHRDLGGLVARRATQFPFPQSDAACEVVLAQVEARLEATAGTEEAVGAIVVEPIQGRGGVRIPPRGFLAGLRRLCDRHGALLVFDEIFTGIGRTGRWFALEHEGVAPDLFTVGKALGGGLPISACLGRAEVIDAWGESTGEARYTTTFLGHPLACRAALGVLEILEGENKIAAVADHGRRFMADLETELSRFPYVGEIRGRGLMIGIEIVRPGTGEAHQPAAWRLTLEALRRGLIVLPSGPAGNVVSLTPPFVLTDEQARCAVEILAESAAVIAAG